MTEFGHATRTGHFILQPIVAIGGRGPIMPGRQRTAADGRSTAARGARAAPTFATVADVQAVAELWTDAQLECRDTGHHWQPLDVLHVVRERFYRINHGCSRCGMVRTREMSERGHVYAQTYRYPEGYLAEGVGRIAGDAKDAVRLASIRRTPITEVRGKPKPDEQPRFSATRRGEG